MTARPRGGGASFQNEMSWIWTISEAPALTAEDDV
jgi:hypothetical protein